MSIFLNQRIVCRSNIEIKEYLKIHSFISKTAAKKFVHSPRCTRYCNIFVGRNTLFYFTVGKSVFTYQNTYVTFPLSLHNQLLVFTVEMTPCLHWSPLTHCTRENSWPMLSAAASNLCGTPSGTALSPSQQVPAGLAMGKLTHPPTPNSTHQRADGTSANTTTGKSHWGEEQLPKKGWRDAAEGGSQQTTCPQGTLKQKRCQGRRDVRKEAREVPGSSPQELPEQGQRGDRRDSSEGTAAHREDPAWATGQETRKSKSKVTTTHQPWSPAPPLLPHPRYWLWCAVKGLETSKGETEVAGGKRRHVSLFVFVSRYQNQ